MFFNFLSPFFTYMYIYMYILYIYTYVRVYTYILSLPICDSLSLMFRLPVSSFRCLHVHFFSSLGLWMSLPVVGPTETGRISGPDSCSLVHSPTRLVGSHEDTGDVVNL